MGDFVNVAMEVLQEQICQSQQQKSGVDDNNNMLNLQWSQNAKIATAKVIQSQLKTLALDLEAFAKHAKRTTINADDVKLALRRNPSLMEKMKDYTQGEQSKMPKVNHNNNNNSSNSKDVK